MKTYAPTLAQDLCRLAQFGANIVDAHSCFIFLPDYTTHNGPSAGVSAPGSKIGGTKTPATKLRLVGHHSLSTDVIDDCVIGTDSGLIGWVSKHQRSIHVSPFEHESSTLGMYSASHQLKSFIGIPLIVPCADSQPAAQAGVIACDSKKTFAFSKIQGKLIEGLAAEISNTIRLSVVPEPQQASKNGWEDFAMRVTDLLQTIGADSVEVLRMRPIDFDRIEQACGVAKAIARTSQMYRLIQQALPPQYPTLQLPNGDVVILLDNMTTAFYENKIRAIATHVLGAGADREIQFMRQSLREKQNRLLSLENIILKTAPELLGQSDSEGLYEYRRA